MTKYEMLKQDLTRSVAYDEIDAFQLVGVVVNLSKQIDELRGQLEECKCGKGEF